MALRSPEDIPTNNTERPTEMNPTISDIHNRVRLESIKFRIINEGMMETRVVRMTGMKTFLMNMPSFNPTISRNRNILATITNALTNMYR